MSNLGHTDTKLLFTIIHFRGLNKIISGPKHHKRAAEELIRLRSEYNEQTKNDKTKTKH